MKERSAPRRKGMASSFLIQCSSGYDGAELSTPSSCSRTMAPTPAFSIPPQAPSPSTTPAPPTASLDTSSSGSPLPASSRWCPSFDYWRFTPFVSHCGRGRGSFFFEAIRSTLGQRANVHD
ncbi:hypothetical protein Syun_018558 [Stephania yunnanensis]|uniref:Uncharacterized protein n=1 Tax=Stephania yunnanensis TaxID=152371 RepID=A0AAP0NYI1_9MAGN